MHRGGHSTADIRAGCQAARQLGEHAQRHWGIPAGDGEIVALLFAGCYTQDTRLLRSLGGFDLDTAVHVRYEARRRGVWKAPCLVGSDWSDPDSGETALLLDYMTVKGQIHRILKDGEVYYDSLDRPAVRTGAKP
jgi:hypothetical protein